MSFTGLRDAVVKARKAHRCESCGGTIPVGSRYSRRTYVFDGQLMDEKLHTYCRSELDWYLDVTNEDEFEWDHVWDFVSEELTAYGYSKDD